MQFVIHVQTLTYKRCYILGKHFACKVPNYYGDKHGRKLLLNIEYDDSVYTIANMYCPTSLTERIEF